MLRFTWDLNKEKSNLNKHGISFNEAATIFSDPFELTVIDSYHSIEEYRFLSVGQSIQGRLLVVSYTEREPNIIRIISARGAGKMEKKQYEQQSRH